MEPVKKIIDLPTDLEISAQSLASNSGEPYEAKIQKNSMITASLRTMNEVSEYLLSFFMNDISHSNYQMIVWLKIYCMTRFTHSITAIYFNKVGDA